MIKKICFILIASQFIACKDSTVVEAPEAFNIRGTWKFRHSVEEVITSDSTYKSFAAAKVSFYPPYSMTFHENGTGESDGTPFSYVKNGDTLVVTASGKTARYLITGSGTDEVKLELSKEGLSGVVDNTPAFTALSLKATYKNLEKIRAENYAEGVYRVCSSTLTTLGNSSNSVVKSLYTYNDEGNVASITEISDPGTAHETTGITTKYTLDHRNAGQKLFRVNQDYFRNGQVQYANSVDMDEAFRIKYTSTAGAGVKFPTYTFYQYDATGRLISKRLEEFAWTSTTRPYEKETYEYNNNGNVIKVYREAERNGTVTPKYLYVEYTYTPSPVKVSTPFIFNYGTKGSQPYYTAERKSYNSDGTLADDWRQEKYEYEFDSLGRILKRSVYDGAAVLKSVTTYEYGCNSTP